MKNPHDQPAHPMGRSPSIRMVAREAGVSTATVSRIINGITDKASPETVARVRDVVLRTGYRPSGAAQALRRRESRLVALIAANLSNPAMSAIAASVEAALRECGFVMVLCDSHDQPSLQDEYLREMQAQGVRGFILLGAIKSPVLDSFDRAGEAIVFVNRINPYGRPSVHVGVDNVRAATDVVQFLQRHNITQTIVIHGALTSSATATRLNTFLERFRQHIGTNVHVMGSDHLNHLDIGYQHMQSYLHDHGTPPPAIFCMSDLIAYGVTRAIREAGFSPYAQSLIIGFDDNPLNDWIAPELTSVRVPYEAFGPVIMQSITRLWAGERNFCVYLPHRLVMRGGGIVRVCDDGR